MISIRIATRISSLLIILLTKALADCDVLVKNACGATEVITVSGKTFAKAVAHASNSNGSQSVF